MSYLFLREGISRNPQIQWGPIASLRRRPSYVRSSWALSAQHPHEDKLNNIRIDEQKLGATVALRPGDGVHRSRACITGRVWKEDVFQRTKLDNTLADWLGMKVLVRWTYQEERISQERVNEHNPADPTTSASSRSKNLRRHQGNDDAHKFIA